MCGFCHSTLVTTPVTLTGLESSYSAAKEWWAHSGMTHSDAHTNKPANQRTFIQKTSDYRQDIVSAETCQICGMATDAPLETPGSERGGRARSGRLSGAEPRLVGRRTVHARDGDVVQAQVDA